MSPTHAAFATWASWIVPVLANHVWQSSVFAAVVLLAALPLRRSPARVRHALWLLALLKFAVPAAAFGVLVPSPDSPSQLWVDPVIEESHPALATAFVEPLSPLRVGLRGAFASSHSEWPCFLVGIWLLVAAALLMVRSGRALGLSWRLRDSHAASARDIERLRSATTRLRSRQRVGLAVSSAVAAPGVWGVFRPRVMLGESLSSSLGDEELEAVLMHELVHVRRLDNLVSTAQGVVCCLFWFHPLLWLLDRRLLAERELACDEAVVAVLGHARDYVSALLKIARLCCASRVAGMSYAAQSGLRGRVEALLSGAPIPRFSGAQRVLSAVIVLGVVGGTVTLGVVGRARADAAGRRQLELRGRYMARQLASASWYGVLIESSRELEHSIATAAVADGVEGVTVRNRRGKVLARQGEMPSGGGADGPAESVHDGRNARGARVLVFRAPVPNMAEPSSGSIGTVEIALASDHQSADEERRLRGQYVASHLARLSWYGLLIEDEAELERWSRAALLFDVVGVTIRSGNGRFVFERGVRIPELQRTESPVDADTDTGQPVTIFHAPVVDRLPPGKLSQGTGLTGGEVLVALSR
jgi:beta-lactamase regulating signal transducer with metallopeptidase domain